MKKIKVGILVAYDWEFVIDSLPLIYPYADEITIAFDKNFTTWCGEEFDIPMKFAAWLHQLDRAGKIEIYAGDFYDPKLTAMQNEVRERNMLAEQMGAGGWHVQIDSDEMFYQFPAFVSFLRRLEKKVTGPVDVAVSFISVVKKINEPQARGYVYVANDFEVIYIATNEPQYKYGRNSGHKRIYAPFTLVNQNFARSEEEMQMKLRNWGHKNDFDTAKWFEKWKALNYENYMGVSDLHPVKPRRWNKLRFVHLLSELRHIKPPLHILIKNKLKKLKQKFVR
jgi:hypothetical protein